MKIFPTKVLGVSEAAKKTLALKLEKPTDFSFEAGQYSVLVLPKLIEDDPRGASRCMSIASAPYEDHLLFSMRLSESGYKKTMASLFVGDDISVGNPVGRFTLLSGDSRPVVFLVGGIGITPARSILRQANRNTDPREFFLFFSNRSPADAPFLDELRSLPNISYRPIFTMTDPELPTGEWDSDRGYIRGELLKKYLPDILAPIYYLVGTMSFTRSMESMLSDLGVGKESIKQDPFVGL